MRRQIRFLRPVLSRLPAVGLGLGLVLALCGCDPTGLGVAGGLTIAAIPVFGRTVPDLAVSAVSGRNCSLVHLDAGEPYCTPTPPPPALPYCTRSLGVADCWADPWAVPNLPQQIADTPLRTPSQITAAQGPWLSYWLGF